MAGEKGSQEYNDIIGKLESTNYAHQTPDSKVEEDEPEVEEEEESLLVPRNDMSKVRDGQVAPLDESMLIKSVILKKEKAERFHTKNAGWTRIMSYYEPKSYACLSFFFSILNAFSFPLLGICVSRMYFGIMNLSKDPVGFEYEYKLTLGLFLVFIVCSGIFAAIEKTMYGVAGEHLTHNVRLELLKGIIYKQISWFDSDQKAPGVLTNLLSSDITALNGMTTQTLSLMVNAYTSIGLALVLALVFEWRTAIFAFCASPIIGVGAFGLNKLSWNGRAARSNNDELIGADSTNDFNKANALLSDIILNYKTVISFGDENVNSLIDEFELLLIKPVQSRIRSSHIAGILFGYS